MFRLIVNDKNSLFRNGFGFCCFLLDIVNFPSNSYMKIALNLTLSTILHFDFDWFIFALPIGNQNFPFFKNNRQPAFFFISVVPLFYRCLVSNVANFQTRFYQIILLSRFGTDRQTFRSEFTSWTRKKYDLCWFSYILFFLIGFRCIGFQFEVVLEGKPK